jgi:hypothetical protein
LLAERLRRRLDAALAEGGQELADRPLHRLGRAAGPVRLGL